MHEIDKQVSDVVISVFDVFVTTEIQLSRNPCQSELLSNRLRTEIIPMNIFMFFLN